MEGTKLIKSHRQQYHNTEHLMIMYWTQTNEKPYK